MRTSLAIEAEAAATSAGTFQSIRRASADRPLDLVHLTRQTFGDKRLESELLRLFLRQAEAIGAALGAPGGDLERLHTLSGSSRAVGAVDVAALAGAGEAALRRRAAGPASLPEPDRRALREAIAKAADYVTALLDQT